VLDGSAARSPEHRSGAPDARTVYLLGATATLVGVGSLFGAALLAILLAAASDMATGLILESWQVRRQLKLEVLGEFDRPA